MLKRDAEARKADPSSRWNPAEGPEQGNKRSKKCAATDTHPTRPSLLRIQRSRHAHLRHTVTSTGHSTARTLPLCCAKVLLYPYESPHDNRFIIPLAHSSCRVVYTLCRRTGRKYFYGDAQYKLRWCTFSAVSKKEHLRKTNTPGPRQSARSRSRSRTCAS